MKISKLLFAHWSRNEIQALRASIHTARRTWKAQARRPSNSPQLQRIYAWYDAVLRRLDRAAQQELLERLQQPKTRNSTRP